MTNEISNRRKQIHDVLEVLASEDEQLEYERNVPHVNITVELVCMWFDDAYHAKWAQRDPAFSPAEKEALASFNQFFDKRVSKLPESRGTVRTWLDSQIWREVMHEARKTLDQISE